MQIIKKNISDLKTSEINTRLHGNKQIKEYIRSINMFGQIRPIVIDDTNMIICGNGLFQALREMGRTTADCYVVKNLSPSQKRKLMLADNKIYELGMNDTHAFDKILTELNGDIDIPGYDEELLRILTADTKTADEYISNYGKFDENTIQSMRNVTPTNYTVLNKPEEDVHKESLPIQTSSLQTEKAAETNSELRKFIICPKCGEKIWL